MIPTTFKSKHPKTLSYPLGAEAISDALGDAPHIEEIRLTFFCHVARVRQVIDAGLPLCVLWARYNPEINMVFESHWEISVYCIPSSLRKHANQALIEKGLPAVVVWLQSSIGCAWDDRKHSGLKLMYDPIEETLSIAEENRA